MPSRLIRFLCLAAACYGACDAFVFDGPLDRALSRLLHQDDGAVAARVGGHPILRSQLERAIADRLPPDGVPPDEALRTAALDDLIDQALLDLRIAALEPAVSVSDAEIDGGIAQLTTRFGSADALDVAMHDQGLADRNALRAHVAAGLRRGKGVEALIAAEIRVTPEEVRAWYEAHPETSAEPERLEVRHIFLATRGRPPEEAREILETALAALSAKSKDFPTLARELSEDPTSKDHGGALGWMSRRRMPADFAAPVFQLADHAPALVRTRLGWHLVEVTNRLPAAPRPFESAAPEISAALEASKRNRAVGNLRRSLRQSGAPVIEIPASRPE